MNSNRISELQVKCCLNEAVPSESCWIQNTFLLGELSENMHSVNQKTVKLFNKINPRL